jgi:two-component system OmpR family response regulator
MKLPRHGSTRGSQKFARRTAILSQGVAAGAALTHFDTLFSERAAHGSCNSSSIQSAMPATPHVAVVDDHKDIRELVGRYLGEHGFRVSVAESAASFRHVLERSALDLVVLDIMMPGEDGLSLCRQLRATTALPIIMLTAVAEDTDRIIGLEMGADDYLTKPFNPRELLARIKAVLRRAHSLPLQRADLRASTVRFEDRVFDVGRREVIGPDGVAVPLSTAECRLLTVFIEHPGMVLTRDQLLDLTSGRSADVWDRSIDNQVSRLRRKIETDPRKPTLIKTHWGGGYRFTADVRATP